MIYCIFVLLNQKKASVSNLKKKNNIKVFSVLIATVAEQFYFVMTEMTSNMLNFIDSLLLKCLIYIPTFCMI